MNNKHITWLILTVLLFALVALGTFAFVQVNTNDGFRDAFSNVLDEIDYKRGDVAFAGSAEVQSLLYP